MERKDKKDRPHNKKEENLNNHDANRFSRRDFLQSAGIGIAALGLSPMGCTENKPSESDQVIQGFDETVDDLSAFKEWEPISDRKVRVGIVGYGFSRWGASFGFQDHPNVDVVAVSDLIPDRCAELAKATRCEKTYPSLEELIKDENIDAVFVATDAPNHGQHAIKVLEHGKHVVVAVPAVFGSLEEADQVLEAVRRSGLKYMMFETSWYRANNYAMRQIYKAGGFGRIIYSEGEYYHPRRIDSSGNPIQLDSFNGWRLSMPPLWYPTHSTAYYTGVTGGSFTEVSGMGIPGISESKDNRYNNPFDTEVGLFRTSEGGASRMTVCKGTQGFGSESGRVRGERGSFYDAYEGLEENLPDLRRPGLPPGVSYGGHGGSHGPLMQEFIYSILQDRQPLVDIIAALNMTVPGIVAHESAMKGGELMEIPQYEI